MGQGREVDAAPEEGEWLEEAASMGHVVVEEIPCVVVAVVGWRMGRQKQRG